MKLLEVSNVGIVFEETERGSNCATACFQGHLHGQRAHVCFCGVSFPPKRERNLRRLFPPRSCELVRGVSGQAFQISSHTIQIFYSTAIHTFGGGREERERWSDDDDDGILKREL
jgi:hypothetical protein